ncbi:hypothetical protein BGZ76_006542 [Entomortierella beljakovae]|nr:hypothetical protein BGZ76_006542 [Entomortierella beljakovae]
MSNTNGQVVLLTDLPDSILLLIFGYASIDDEVRGDSTTPAKVDQQGDSNMNENGGESKRTKFYSRFEQRAHRRKFASLDPELKFTPLSWTNTQWTWKRTYFGDCRFVQSEDIRTPNRIDRMLHRNNIESAREECSRCWRPVSSCICSALSPRQYCNCRVRIMILQHPRCQVSIGTIRILKLSFKYCQIIIGKDFNVGRSLELDQTLEDPNCTPFLLYPSFSAIDIHRLAEEISNESSEQSDSRFHCRGCIHHPQDPSSVPSSSTSDLSVPEDKPYPYRLIIALDGTWSHAKLMYRFNPRLQQLAQIKFPSPPQSIYHQLKPEPKPTYTSTAEAVGQAIALLGWPNKDNAEDSEKGQDKPLSDADLLFEDLIRPLKLIIEIQGAITKDLKTPEQEQGQEQVQEQE